MMDFLSNNGPLLGLCAGVAGVAGAVKDLRSHEDKGFEWSMLYAGLVSAFTGFIVTALILHFYPQDSKDGLISVAASGLAGWIGPGLLDLLAGVFQKLVQSKVPDPKLPEAKQPDPPKAPGSSQ